MSDCNNNCDAVAGLHEASANLIQYRNQIDKWLNGNANETVNIGGVNTPTLRNLAMSIKQLVGVYPDEQSITIDSNKKIKVKLKNKGGIKYDAQGLYLTLANSGLIVDDDGNIAIDFSQMPTDRFDEIIEEFRKSLRLQKWLSGHKNFYVNKNHPNASNVLDEGRGETADKPFASIQPCINYVCDNYNFSRYNVYINIAAGVYQESVNCYDYVSSGGVLYLIGEDTGNAPLTTTIKTHEVTTISFGKNVFYSINIKYHKIYTPIVYQFSVGLYIQSLATLYLERFELLVDFEEGVPADRFVRPIRMEGKLMLRLLNNLCNGPSKITINNYSQGMDAIFRLDNGIISMEGKKSDLPDIICSGAHSVFMRNGGGKFGRNTGYNPVLGFSGEMTGQRYRVSGGGYISVGGLGPDYFPGSIDGYVDTSTYSWYK